MKTLFPLFILFTSLLIADDSTTTSSWSSYGKKQPTGESFDVSYILEIKGKYENGEVVYQGKGRLKHRRLEQLFAKQKLSQQQRTETTTYQSLQEKRSGYEDSFSYDVGYVSIQKAGFKVLKFEPQVPTSDVSFELFIGEESYTPHLEALNVRLNPFKKTKTDVVQNYFEEIDLRHLKAIIRVKCTPGKDIQKAEFKAELNLVLTVGDMLWFQDSGDEYNDFSDPNK